MAHHTSEELGSGTWSHIPNKEVHIAWGNLSADNKQKAGNFVGSQWRVIPHFMSMSCLLLDEIEI
jgi:hypothetical protein